MVSSYRIKRRFWHRRSGHDVFIPDYLHPDDLGWMSKIQLSLVLDKTDFD